MTNASTIALKTIASLIEAIDADDPKDADLAVKMIKAILEAGEKK
jgi:hypothetical protein